MGKTYYDILEIPQQASPEEIKKSYRRLVLLWHPDKHSSKSPQEQHAAMERFREIQHAYEILSDPENKMLYDNGCLKDTNFVSDDIENVFVNLARNISTSMRDRFSDGESAATSILYAGLGALGGFMLGSLMSLGSRNATHYPSLFASIGALTGASAPIIYSSVVGSLEMLEPTQRRLLIDMALQFLQGYTENR